MTDDAQLGLDPVDALAQLSFLVQGLLADRVAEHDLSVIQVRLLGVLRDRKPTMNELARLLRLDKSSVTGLVARAERRGLVARAPSTTDGRSVTVAVTPAGRRLIRTVSGRFAADVQEALAVLPAGQRRTLTQLAARLVIGHAEQRGVDLAAGRSS